MQLVISWALKLATLLLTVGCVTTKPPMFDFGVQPGHQGFVPARIALAPCQLWPQSASFASMVLTRPDLRPTADELCQELKDFVVAGFSDQPYMTGYSESAVRKLLALKDSDLLETIFESWEHQRSDCQACESAASFYQQSIANRPQWRSWLNQFSATVRNADAILLPVVDYVYEATFDDRGLTVSKRGASVTLLLIDTNSGDLIWTQNRSHAIANQQLPDQKGSVQAPPWDRLFELLLTKHLWKDFPGRLAN